MAVSSARLSRLLFGALLLVGIALVIGLGLSTVAGASGSAADADSSTNGTIAPDLQDASGEQTVIVRFAGSNVTGAVDPTSANASGDRQSIETLKRNAATEREPFDRFADRTAGVSTNATFWTARAALVTVDTDRVPLDRLTAVEGVVSVHPNVEVSLDSAATAEETAASAAVAAPDARLETAAPNAGPDLASADEVTVTDAATTYGIEEIRAPSVWDTYDARGGGVRVAVIDTGVDPDHPDITLADDGWAEFDIGGESVDSDPHDPQGHGTHVSGTVAGGNASGTAIGVAPDAELYHAKSFDESGSTTFAAIAAGLDWALESDVDVIVMSFGTNDYVAEFIEPIRTAESQGVVTVSAAGNDEDGSSSSPANVVDTLAVGATDVDRAVASFSSGESILTEEAWGSDAPDDWPDEYLVPDLSAPGVQVTSAAPGGDYVNRSGTSMAAPHVGGLVALVASVDDDVTTGEARTAIESSTRHPEDGEPDTRYGSGIADGLGAAALVTGDALVDGTVTDDAGDPVENVTVESELGPATTTDAAGGYELTVPQETQSLTAGPAFGLESETATVDPPTTRDFTLSRVSPAFERTSERPDAVDPGSSLTVDYRVANVDELAVETDTSYAIAGDDLVIRVDGETVSEGQSVDVADRSTVTVEIHTPSEAAGLLDTTVTFVGAETDTDVVSGVPVHDRPLVLDADGPVTLGEATTFVADGTTIRLSDGTYSVPAEGVMLDRDVSIEGADGAVPTIEHAGADSETGAVDIAASGSTLANVSIATDAVGISVTGTEFTIGDADSTDDDGRATVSNVLVDAGDAGVRVRNTTAVALHGITVDSATPTGVVVADAAGTTVSESDIEASDTSIRVTGSSDETTVTDVSVDSVETTPVTRLTDVRVDGGLPMSGAIDAVRIESATEPTDPPENRSLIGTHVVVSASGDSAGSIDVSYAEADLGEINQSSVAVWRHVSDWNRYTTIEQHDTEHRTLTVDPLVSGEYAVFGDEGDLTERERYLRSIANDDGVITLRSLSTAFSDWQRGVIDVRDLSAAFRFWQSGESVA